jgi:hypothetical protein
MSLRHSYRAAGAPHAMWSLLGSSALALILLTAGGCRERLSSRPGLFGMSYLSGSPMSYHRVEIDSTALRYTYYEAPETLVWVMQFPCYADSELTTLTASLSQQDLDELARVVNRTGFLSLPDTMGSFGQPPPGPYPSTVISTGRCCDQRTKVHINGPMPQAFKDVRAALASLVQAKFGRALYVVPTDSPFAMRLAAPLSGWLARTAESRPEFALSGFRRVSEDKVAIRPRQWSTNELWADRVQVWLRQKFGYIRYSPDSSRYVDLNLYGEIVVTKGDTQFLSGPDQTVLLVDPARRTTARLQFHGTAGRTEEAVWLDDSTLALAGWEEAQPPTEQVRAPFVRVLRLNSGQRTTYVWSGDDRK